MAKNDALIEKLTKLSLRFDELTKQTGDPATLANMELFRKLTKEHSEISPIIDEFKEYQKHAQEMDDCEALLAEETDPEMKNMLRQEVETLKTTLEEHIHTLKTLLLPKDPNDDNNVVMEIRAGAGGEEAGLFGTELMKMYYHYADGRRWKIEEINMNMTELGGVKEVVFMVTGKGAYSRLKYESGVHRVQRVPATETQGRVHTSTVTVAVLPEVEDVQVVINENDLKIDTFRSGGAGGQHVNKTESAIRITHIPTGLVVICEDERSQFKNRDKAMKVLKSRLYDFYQSQASKEYADNRRSQVGTGDRSERIRTYNFPQGRVTDHRIGMTLYSLDNFLLGDMDDMINALAIDYQNKLLLDEQN